MLRDAIGIASGLSRHRNGSDSRTQRYSSEVMATKRTPNPQDQVRFLAELLLGSCRRAAGALRMRANRGRYPAIPPRARVEGDHRGWQS